MQKYNKGDLVRISKDLGPSMSHFTSDCDAIVMYTYDEKYGGGNVDSYCLHLKGRGQVSWYFESQLTLIEKNRNDLLKKWEDEENAESEMKGNLDWIFSHGDEVLAGPHFATVATLAKCFGLTNLWGSRGEGITYFLNAMGTLAMAEPFLKAGDKEGWLNHCATLGR